MPMPTSRRTNGWPVASQLAVALVDRALHRDRRGDRALRVIVGLDRRAEVREDRVADVLVDGRAVLEQAAGDQVEALVQERDGALRPDRAGESGELADVEVDHRHLAQLALQVDRFRRVDHLAQHVVGDVAAERGLDAALLAQALAHLVEGAREHADLVARGRLDARRQIARRERVHRQAQTSQRPRQDSRDDERDHQTDAEQDAGREQHLAPRGANHATGDGVDVEHDLRLADVEIAVRHARRHDEHAAVRASVASSRLGGHALAQLGFVVARRRDHAAALVEHARDGDLGLLRDRLEQLREREIVLEQERLARVARQLLGQNDRALAGLVGQRLRAALQHDQRDRADRADQKDARQERELEAQREDHWREIPFPYKAVGHEAPRRLRLPSGISRAKRG